jgi:hypothetical protein
VIGKAIEGVPVYTSCNSLAKRVLGENEADLKLAGKGTSKTSSRFRLCERIFPYLEFNDLRLLLLQRRIREKSLAGYSLRLMAYGLQYRFIDPVFNTYICLEKRSTLMTTTTLNRTAFGSMISMPVPGVKVIDAFLVSDSNARFNDFLQFVLYRFTQSALVYENTVRGVRKDDERELLAFMAQLKMDTIHRLYEDLRLPQRNDGGVRTKMAYSMTHYLMDVELRPISCLEDAFHFAHKREKTDNSLDRKSVV